MRKRLALVAPLLLAAVACAPAEDTTDTQAVDPSQNAADQCG